LSEDARATPLAKQDGRRHVALLAPAGARERGFSHVAGRAAGQVRVVARSREARDDLLLGKRKRAQALDALFGAFKQLADQSVIFGVIYSQKRFRLLERDGPHRRLLRELTPEQLRWRPDPARAARGPPACK
jgi:hypothetical protein